MAILNFSGLRSNKPQTTTTTPTTPIKRTVTTTPIKRTGQNIVPPYPQRIETRYHKNDLLIASGFCYSCTRFSIDAPHTPTEKGWCMRNDDEGGHAFFAINPEHQVGQCPLVCKIR